MQRPTIGRIVTYRTDGRNGLSYDLPAIITCTKETHPGNYPDGQKNPLPIPESDTHVHLTVFSPGGYGTARSKDDVKVANYTVSEDFPQMEERGEFMLPGSGTYVEWNIPLHNPGETVREEPTSDGAWVEAVPPRTWRWPTIR